LVPLLELPLRSPVSILVHVVVSALTSTTIAWAVIVNTLDNVGVSDLALTVCILVLFILGFALGFLEMSRVISILVLGVLGGLAIGVRIILLRSGLLISDPDAFFVNWLIIGVCGIAGSILVVWKQGYGIVCRSAKARPGCLLTELLGSSTDVLQLVRFYVASD
jgi:hypothetical protein